MNKKLSLYAVWHVTPRKIISAAVMLLCVPIMFIISRTVFGGKQFAFLGLVTALLCCLPFFIAFERGRPNTARLIIVAAMTALSVAGRMLFSLLPGIKPVAALVIITGMYFGCESGFMTGALTAIISNIYFGQGPWTFFQMFAWGMIGVLSGLLARPLKKNILFLCIYGALSGILFSAILDIWSTLWTDNAFSISRYLTFVASSAPSTVKYAVSNVIFLALLAIPLKVILERLKKKYNI